MKIISVAKATESRCEMVPKLICGTNTLRYLVTEYKHPWDEPDVGPKWKASVSWHRLGTPSGAHWKMQCLGIYDTFQAAWAAALSHRESYVEPAYEGDVFQGHRHFEE